MFVFPLVNPMLCDEDGPCDRACSRKPTTKKRHTTGCGLPSRATRTTEEDARYIHKWSEINRSRELMSVPERPNSGQTALWLHPQPDGNRSDTQSGYDHQTEITTITPIATSL